MGSNTRALAVPSSAVPTVIAPDRHSRDPRDRGGWPRRARSDGARL